MLEQYGHIAMEVSGTKYKFLIEPSSLSEVDIVDFAPRAVSGSPAWSEMGLYVDVSQEGFTHGFGQHTYSEPKSYAYSGSNVDTRHGYISLYTDPTLVNTGGTAGWTVNKMQVHDGVRVLATSSGLQMIRPDTGAISDALAMPTGTECRDILSTGQYFLATQSDQTQICDVVEATAGANTTITDSAASWTVDIFAGGTVYIMAGTGAGQSRAVSSNTATQITVGAAWDTNPDNTSFAIVINDTGQASADNFDKLTVFGGYFWTFENSTNYLHFGAESDGSDLEGGGTADTAVIQVGTSATDILDMLAFNNQLWVFKEDGVWTVGEDNLAYHTLSFADELSSSNFNAKVVWDGFAVFSVRNTLYKYRSGLQDLTPPIFDEYPPYKKFGDFSGLLARSGWLFMLAISNEAFSDETAETTTGYGALLSSNGVGWHKLWTFPQTAPTDMEMWLDNVNDILYVFGYSGGKGYLYSIQLQATSDLAYADYPTSTYCNWYSSWYDMGVRRISKSFASITLSGDFPTNTSVRIQYRVDDTTSWTTLATVSNDMDEQDFPAATTGKKIQFRLQLYTTTATSTPFIRAIILKVMLRPEVLYGVTCDVLVSNKLSDSRMLVQGMTAAEIRTALKACRDSTAPITFTDIHGASASAYLASLRFMLLGYEDSDAVQYVARCTIVYV